MSMVQEFATFLNKFERMVDRRKWKGVNVDALDKLFHSGVYRGHVEFGELVLPSTLDTGTTSMLLRMWGGFRMLKDIAGGRIVPRGDGAFFEWPDPNEVGVATADPLQVANPEGIVPETRIDTFVMRLNGGRIRLASGAFSAKPWCSMYYVYSGRQIVGNIEADSLMVAPGVDPEAADWMRATWRLIGGSCTSDRTAWRSPDMAPAIRPRVQRFLTALTDYDISFRDDYGHTVKAPFTATVLPSQNVIVVIGNGVEFGEVRGDDFTPDTVMPCDIRAILRHMWREIIREESLLERLAVLEAECAEKTRQIDQIAAILKGRK